MKVVYIAVHSEQGGASRSLVEMVKTMKRNYPDVEPIVLTCKNSQTKKEYDNFNIENYVTRHRAFGFGRESNKIMFYIKFIPRYLRYLIANLYALYKAQKMVDFSKVDIIHSNATRNDIGAILAKKYNIPHVWHLREFGTKGYDYDVFYYRNRPLKYINENADHFIAVSNAVKKHWVNQGFDPKKISVVYNGIDVSKFKVKNTNKVNNKYKVNNKLKIVFSGFLMESKGQIQLIEALSKLSCNIKENILVDFIGSGTKQYEAFLKNKVQELELENCIRFLGYQDDIPERLQYYDVGVICSRAEGFGRVTVEYMLAKLCVIASDTGANPEIVDNGITGFLYSYGDTEDLARVIKYLYYNREIVKECGIKGYKKAMKNYTTEINCKNIYKVYKQILESKRKLM